MLLCVDPDPTAREGVRAALADVDGDVEGCGTLADALTALGDGTTVECLVTAYDLPDGTGLELVAETRERSPDTACILFTERSLDEFDTAAVGDVVAEYVPKSDPDASQQLFEMVRQSLAFRSQTAYPLPDDEDARLAALDRYAADSDGLADALDRLTRLATALFDVESAAVGLVDAHTERFLACHGAAFDEMLREETICTYTILDEEVTVVPDVRDDPRFAANEGLAAAGIRFYAGAPLVTPEGRAIGVLCLHDGEPRSFSRRDRDLLTALAAEAMEQLELRRRLRRSAREETDVY